MKPSVPLALLALAVLALVLSFAALPVVSQEAQEEAVVTSIIDGDTINVRIGEVGYRVRYIGVNTPERGDSCYAEATEANRELVLGKTVRLVRDESNTDRFGRLLRYVYVDDTFINAELVAQGWAEAREYPPDTAHADELEALEAEAREQGLGCHEFDVFGPAGEPVEVTEEPVTLLYVRGTQNVNARAEASTTSAIVMSIRPGTEVELIEEVEGEFVLGGDVWYHVRYDGEEVYVHGSLLTDQPQSRVGGSLVNGSQQQQVQQPAQQPVQQPVQQEQPIQQEVQPQQPVEQPPVQVQPTLPPPPPPTEVPPPPAPSFTCDCSKSCTAMASCEEAYFQLNTCGCGRRDGDNDGVPCEDICPGG